MKKVDRFLNDSPLGGFVLICLILTSILTFTLETEFHTILFFKSLSMAIAIIFGVEYLLRVWSAAVREGGRIGYVFSFYGLIDLIAFLPALILPVASGSVLLRTLRLLRLTQILKIQSVRQAIFRFSKALSRAKNDLIVSFAFSGFLIFIGAVGMFYIEGKVQPEAFGSIPRALWWSVATLTTVGYGDVYPITVSGKILASIIALIGIAAVAMPAGILAAAFSATISKSEFKNRTNSS